MGTSAGFASINTSSSLLQSQENRLIQGANSTSAINDAKIDKGAKEFEAVLMGSWLQQSEQSFASLPGSEDDEEAAGREQTMSFGVQQLATSLAASGGIGIGKMIAKAMHAKADKANGEQASQEQPVAVRITHEKPAELH
jgi:Rod binding domain-containing protein